MISSSNARNRRSPSSSTPAPTRSTCSSGWTARSRRLSWPRRLGPAVERPRFPRVWLDQKPEHMFAEPFRSCGYRARGGPPARRHILVWLLGPVAAGLGSPAASSVSPLSPSPRKARGLHVLRRHPAQIAPHPRASSQTGEPWPCQPWAWSTLLINFRSCGFRVRGHRCGGYGRLGGA
jgi:hypothetical protein